ncbi:hypothetical protein V2G26_008596 [Clonostachys chloroleuca]
MQAWRSLESPPTSFVGVPRCLSRHLQTLKIPLSICAPLAACEQLLIFSCNYSFLCLQPSMPSSVISIGRFRHQTSIIVLIRGGPHASSGSYTPKRGIVNEHYTAYGREEAFCARPFQE